MILTIFFAKILKKEIPNDTVFETKAFTCLQRHKSAALFIF